MDTSHSTNLGERDFGNYIAGFTDGEGCFYLGKHRVASGSFMHRATFAIALRADDRPILDDIQKRLGCGTVLIHKTKCREKSRLAASFKISKIGDLAEKIIPFFHQYQLRGKKRGDFEIWSKGVLLVYEVMNRLVGPHYYRRGHYNSFQKRWTPEDAEKFDTIVAELRAFRANGYIQTLCNSIVQLTRAGEE